MCNAQTPPVDAKAEAMDATLISSGAHTYTGRTRAIMTASYILCFGCIGVCLGSLGPILLALSERLHEDVDTLGMLFVFRSAGYLGGSLAAGWLFDFVTRPHAILLLALTTCAVGTASIPLWRDYRAVGAALSTQGACMGVLDTGGNVLMIWLWGADRYEPYLQAMHFMFGLGAFLAPIAIEAALAATATADSPAGDFGPSFFVIAVTMAAFAAPLLCTRGPQPSAEERAKSKGASSKRGGARWRLELALTLLSSALLALYVGAEVAAGGFIFAYAVEEHGMGATMARLLNSSFWGALTAGRLAAIPLAAKWTPTRMLTLSLGGAVIGAAWLSMTGREPGVDGVRSESGAPSLWAAVALFGLSMAAIFPTAITHMERVMAVSGRTISVLVVGASLGEMLIPLGVAVAYPPDALGRRSFPRILTAACVAQAAVFVGAWHVGRRLAALSAPTTPTTSSSHAADELSGAEAAPRKLTPAQRGAIENEEERVDVELTPRV